VRDHRAVLDRLGALSALLLLYSGELQAQGPQLPNLHLTEVSAVTLPDSLHFTQGLLSDHGRIVLWSRSQILEVGPGVELNRVCPERFRAIVGVGLISDGSSTTIEVLEGGTHPRHVRFLNGECTANRLPGSIRGVIAATVVDAEWRLLSTPPPDGLEMWTKKPSGTWQKRRLSTSGYALEAVLGAASDTLPLMMAPGFDGTALVGLRPAPFSWFALSSDGTFSTPANPLELVPEAGRSGPWFSTSLGALGSAVLQVMADASSARREVLLFTNDGAPTLLSRKPSSRNVHPFPHPGGLRTQ